MKTEEWFKKQDIQPVQDRKDYVDYESNYNLYTEVDLLECLEAYHREKSWEDFTEEFDEVGKAQKIVGRLEERERILGIIESLKLKDVDVKTDYGQGVRHGYEILYDALIEKIKG